MPFTFAHPAIILPLKQAKPRWFSLTGLVAGSMAPDFEYFFKVHATSTVSETLAGIFTFNLPVAAGISLLFHQVVRNPLIRHLPRPYDKRFSGFLKFNFLKYLRRHPFRYLSSAFIGVVSHLLLDIITSPETMTRSFHRLQSSRFSEKLLRLEAGLGSKSFAILEHSFSVVGLLFIGYLLSQVNCPAKGYLKEHTEQKRRYFGVLAAVFVAAMLAFIQFLPYEITLPQLIINSISAGLLSLLVAGILFHK